MSARGNLAPVRVGQGWDIHRLVSGRPLRLGGIEVANDQGLLGHSDGDVVLHAVTDALLGAMADGDIGRHFPDTDERYRGLDSGVLLSEVGRRAARRGYRIGNIDVTILAERPKLAPHLPVMQRRVAELLGVAPAQVGIKAKTAEGIGAIGAGDAIAALAVIAVTAPTRPTGVRARRRQRPKARARRA